MKGTIRSLILGLVFLPLLSFFQNCSNVSFDSTSADVDGTAVNPPQCRVDMVSTTKTVKVLFLIDVSGSNAGNNGGPGTDEGKVWRLRSINDFLNVYQSKTNFEFGFATFKESSSAVSLIKDGTRGVFTHDSAKINQAIIDFKNTTDHGNTPYDAALDLVKDMVKYDRQTYPQQDAVYAVIMVSDGSPSNNNYKDPVNGLNNLSADVNSILAAAPGSISMNTVFLYNASVPAASEKMYLQKISSVGKGAFIEANSQGTIQIADTVTVPSEICD